MRSPAFLYIFLQPITIDRAEEGAVSSKKTKYTDIKKWADKQARQGSGFQDLNAALSAYEASVRETQELKAVLDEKTALRKTARETLEATFKLAKVQAKQAVVIEKKITGSIQKPDKGASKKK